MMTIRIHFVSAALLLLALIATALGLGGMHGYKTGVFKARYTCPVEQQSAKLLHVTQPFDGSEVTCVYAFGYGHVKFKRKGVGQ